ncbi:L,D-transpeptidase family protein [Shewanella psychropiezotolerans]|uniref:L,D-transpeptidase family protein n=2 Tax=Shewanella psychropiezotolerans TaxID=2593655 RepID=A0ABX5WXY6_9GAMM|nr:L,D-transpeptidase family protein [Shewanella psychropiezotolerans]
MITPSDNVSRREIMKSKMFLISLFFCSLIISIPSLSDGNSLASNLSDTQEVELIYELNDQQLIWFDSHGLSVNGLSLAQLLEDLGIGLGNYLSIEQVDRTKLSKGERDRAYTRACLYLLDRVSKLSLNMNLNLELSFTQAIRKHRLSEFIEQVLPLYDEVSQLRGMIRKYKKLTHKPWPNIGQAEFRLGQSSNKISTLRNLLVDLGDLSVKPELRQRASIYDPDIVLGIKSFQMRHGLEVNGQLDTQTAESLSVKPETRIVQMQLNLWRWFSLPNTLPERFVWINIPGYQLQLLDQGEKLLDMKVIVGKPLTPTPIITSSLTRFTVNPSWTPPWSIVSKELIPLDAKYPGYLNRQKFELRKYGASSSLDLVDISSSSILNFLSEYQLVQSPGPENALGKYRFSIPNNHSIYLHDTPSKSLFTKRIRALSHGCIRLSDPKGLLDYLMQADNRAADVERAVRGTLTHYYSIVSPTPVYITYHTSWVDEFGKLQLRPDIYDLDRIPQYDE